MLKNMKPLLILLTLLCSSMAHADTTITVNTTADENGSNSSACSLREAIHVINDKAKKAWGGCAAGGVVGGNIIQLDAQTYTLTLGELNVLTDVTISGKDTIVTDGDDDVTTAIELNPYTGKAPYRKPPVTIIAAAPNSRIISTFSSIGSTLALKDLKLTGGNALYSSNEGNGGAIYASMSLSLDNVIVEASHAHGVLDASVTPNVFRGGMGGAIFLSTSSAGLSLSDSTLRSNDAESTGGALAMVCTENLDLASHTVSISHSLLALNSSGRGAGAIEACGRTTLSLGISTLSGNASAPGFAAVTYRQTVSGQGTFTAVNVTAAEQSGGPVFAVKNVSAIALNNSVLINNSGGNCPADTTGASFPNGNYNAIDDHSCDNLLLPTTNSGNANLAVPAGQFTNELLPLGIQDGWLTAAYLPRTGSQYILNKGNAASECDATDQRNLSRRSGAVCDLGAIERLEPTANDDSGDSRKVAGRVAIIDVLANDVFGEGDLGPNKYADPVADSAQAVTVVNGGGMVTIGTAPPQSVCIWHDKDDPVEEYRNRLVVNNGGVITPDDQPLSCTYHINVVPNGSSTTTSSADVTVTATIKNTAPVAVADVYVRPVGQAILTINPVSNDTDVDDSNGGLLDPRVDVLLSGTVTKVALIHVSTAPQLGKIQGNKVNCPDYTSLNPKQCYTMPIQYVADNSQSPFADSFQYSVYDEDDEASNAVTVTIKTDAPDPNKGETGGSLDIAGGLLLGLLGLRRARKL